MDEYDPLYDEDPDWINPDEPDLPDSEAPSSWDKFEEEDEGA